MRYLSQKLRALGGLCSSEEKERGHGFYFPTLFQQNLLLLMDALLTQKSTVDSNKLYTDLGWSQRRSGICVQVIFLPWRFLYHSAPKTEKIVQ